MSGANGNKAGNGKNLPALIGGYCFLAGVGFTVFTLLWALAAWWLNIPALPGPGDVFAIFPEALGLRMAVHIAASMKRIVFALFFACLFGMFGGILTGYCDKAGRVLSPLLYFTYPIPKLALLPVFLLLLGIGEASKISVIVLILFFPLLVAVRDAVRNVPEEYYAVLISLNASFADKFRHIILPATLPAVFSSLRVSIGIAFSALFFTETSGTDAGLGFYITDCWMRLDYVRMYLGILVLSLAGVTCFMLVDLAERVLSHRPRSD